MSSMALAVLGRIVRIGHAIIVERF